MTSKIKISLTIENQWNVIGKIRKDIANEQRIASYGQDFIEDVQLAAIELLENALKYSDIESNGKPGVDFLLEIKEEKIFIEVNNYCSHKESKEIVKLHIDKLKKEDPFNLYVERMSEIQNQSDGHSRLGIYRIAYESSFSLDCEIKDKNVKIIAWKNLPKIKK